MRKIIEERLENAREEYLKSYNDVILGKCKTYQDCLNLLPAPRTEQEILKDFEALEYSVVANDCEKLMLKKSYDETILIHKVNKYYEVYLDDGEYGTLPTTMQEHKLLHELFTLWGWV